MNPLATQDRIRVKSKTKNALDTLVDKLKARRKGKVTYDDLIILLLDDHAQVGRLERKVTHLEAENTDLKAKLEAGVLPKVEAPVGPEATPETTPETPQDYIIEIPSSQCQYYAEADDGTIHCSKDYDARGVIHRVTEVVCAMCWDRIAKRLQEDRRLAEAYPCLRRFQGQDGNFRCVIHPPEATTLAHGLQTCQACQNRLTEDIAREQGVILRPQYYLDCGAKEHDDPKAGLMVQCSHAGVKTWWSIETCKERECPHLKLIQTEY